VYASRADIETAYGEDVLFGAVGDDGLVDGARIVRALEKAKDEIDSYISVRHALPLPEVPSRLRDVSVDLAIYHINMGADALTDEMRTRYKDGLAWLKDVGAGRAQLGLKTSGRDGSQRSGPRPVVTTGTPRQFSRRAMRDL